MSFKTPKFLKNNKFWVILFALIPLSFLLAPHAMASFGDWAGSVVGGIIGVFIWALGKILVIVIQALIMIASYQHFIDSQAVMEGWRIVRDLANMFFVVILLIIAFSTILHLENFSYKKWLPKLILMAILINFSKTICGLLIDVAQVIMLTFVNAFKDVAGGNFVELLGIKEIVTLSTDTDNIGFFDIVSAYILGLIYMIVALVVIVTMMAMLAMRLVMIWIYVVLSPLAYLLSAFPGGAQYASQWWKEFISNLIVGPVIAFFIWLSFAALQTGSDLDIVSNSQNANSLAEEESEAMHSSVGEEKAPAGTEASKPSVLIKFVIGIGMLIGGLKIAQQVGGSAGAIAGKGMAKLNKLGAVGAGAVGGFALARAKQAGRGALGASSFLVSRAGKMVGNNKVGNSLRDIGGIGLSYRQDLIDAKNKKKVESRKKFMEKIGVGVNTADKISTTFKKDRNNQAVVNTTNLMAMGAAGGFGAAGPIGAIVGAALGGFFGVGMRAMGKYRDNKVDKAQTNVDNKETEYKTAVADLAADPGNAIKQRNMEDKRDEMQTAQTELNTYKGKGTSVKAAWYKMLDSTGAKSTQFTVKAADKLGKRESDARAYVKSVATDPSLSSLASSTSTSFYTSTGQTEDNEARIRHLSDDTPEAQKARENYIAEMDKGTYDPSDKHTQSVLLSLAKGFAATQKKGDVDLLAAGPLMSKIDEKLSTVGLGSISSFKDGAISYRKSGEEGEKGNGGMYVDTFAKNTENNKDKNMIAANFDELKASGIDIETEGVDGMHVPPDLMKPVADALIKQIEAEQSILKSSLANGNIGQDEYNKKNGEFETAKTRLQNPENINDLELINSNSKNFGRDARLTTAYHEQIHGGGVKDEDITEGLAKMLMSNKLYGRNPETGGRHPREVAEMAKGMIDKGASKEEVLAAMGAEISKRSASESQNRADRVLKMESGKEETETEFVSKAYDGDLESQNITVDTKGFENSIKSLEKSLRNSSAGKNDAVRLTRLFTILGNVIRRSDTKTVRALKKLKLNNDTEPIVINAIGDEMK